jgi:hypothetical protein
MNKHSSQLYEQKLKASNVGQNISAGMANKHLGLDLPVGGFGNLAPMGDSMRIGPAGKPYTKKKTPGGEKEVIYDPEIQHGHLYFRWDDFGYSSVPVLDSHTSDLSKETADQSTGSLASSNTDSVVMGAVATTPSSKKEHWLQLPHFDTLDHLEQILRDYGYTHLADANHHKERLFNNIVKDNELSITANEQGTMLKCRGVLIHLVVETEEDGVEKVLVQRHASCLADQEDEGFVVEGDCQDSMTASASALSPNFDSKLTASSSFTVNFDEENPNNATHKVEDIRVPTMLRRRHESWVEAVTRICQSWQLPQKTIEFLIEQCREAEEDMCIYKCKRPESHCHHHSEFISDADAMGKDLEIEYQAYRFKFVMKPKDRHLFPMLSQESFFTTEKGMPLRDFGGHPGGNGTIWRQWEWLPRTRAAMHSTDGLFPPEDRITIKRETDHLSSILLGIENSAPHKENFFGGKHTAAAKHQDTSPFGTRKWKDYRKGGQEVPADIGGMHLSVDPKAFKSLQRLCRKVRLSKPYDGYASGNKEALRAEKDLFKELLQASDEEIGNILFRRLQFTRPVLHGHAGTMVFDAFVRDRTNDDYDEEVKPMLTSNHLGGSNDDDVPDIGDSSDDEQVDQTDTDGTRRSSRRSITGGRQVLGDTPVGQSVTSAEAARQLREANGTTRETEPVRTETGEVSELSESARTTTEVEKEPPAAAPSKSTVPQRKIVAM